MPLIADGLSNADIADELCLQPQTVKNYVSEILHTCGCDRRPKLIKRLEKCLASQN